MKKKYDLFIFTGEASGDLHGEALVKSILKYNPNIKICAVAGPLMRKHNIDCILKMENFQTIGFIDVFFNILKFIKHFFFLRKFILNASIQKCVFIDYPGFSLKLENSLKKHNFKGKIIHYISPTIWAWHKSRINIMKKAIDLVLCILPFEVQCYKNTTLLSKYVGHPLISKLSNFNYKNINKKNIFTIGIFPGSRTKEIERNLPIHLNAAKKIALSNPNISFIISISSKEHKEKVFSIFNNIITNDKEKFSFIDSKDNYSHMKILDLAIATSGTITLELALHEIPSIVTYAIKKLDLIIARNILKINLDHYCIVNIIAKKRMFPELYGPNLSVDSLYDELNNFLTNKELLHDCKKQCEEIKEILGSYCASEEAAKNILTLS